MKGIIFDCDGTLVDTEMAHFQGWAHALKKHDVDFNIEDYFCYVGSPSDKTAQELSNKIGKSCADELRRDKHIFFHSIIKQKVLPIEDTFAFLQRLIKEQKKFGYKLAIASGAPREDIDVYLRKLKIDNHFDIILSGKDDLNHYKDPAGVNKPSPYIYIEAAKRLGLDPRECIAIEDSCAGVTAGVRAGCITVAVPTPFSCKQDFSLAHMVIPSFKDYSVSSFLERCSSCLFSKLFN